MRYLVILNLLLIKSAFTSFTAADAPFRNQSLNTSNGTISVGSPSFSTYPWGPGDFTATWLRHGPFLLARKACFVSAVQMLAEQAAEDFDGRMRSPKMTFTNLEYPEVAIIVSGAAPTDRIQRRYALWGVARMMNHLVRHDTFRDFTFQLYYRGTAVGRVYIGPVPTSLPEIGARAIFVEAPSVEQLNDTAISDETEMLSWQYRYFGYPLTINDVFMGTIGALIFAARPPSANEMSNFVGSFPPYTAVHHWTGSPGQPPPFTYSMLIKSIQATAMHTLDQMVFLELGVRVTNGVQEVAWGGYVRDPSPDAADCPPLLSSI